MYDPDTNEPTPEELANSTALLPEWDRLAVRDYWAEVVAEELGTRQPASARSRWSAMTSRDRVRLRRSERRKEHTELRLVAQVADAAAASPPSSGTAA